MSECGPVLEIHMQTRPGLGERCAGCGREESSGRHGLPTFNGDIVSNDWPGDWGAVPCCEECYERHARGEMPTADHLYRHLFDGFTFGGGAGI